MSDNCAKARQVHMIRAAERAAADPKQVDRAVRIVRAAIERGHPIDLADFEAAMLTAERHGK